MQRIESGGFFAFRRETRDKKDVRRSAEGEPSSFVSLLKDDSNRKVERTEESGRAPLVSVEAAEQHLDDIHALGEKLLKERTFSALRRYKNAVQQFLNVVVKNSLEMEAHSSGSNVMNRKRFSVIQVIDEKLQRLATGMLQTQQPQLDLLRRVEEINGMLVDLTQ